MSGTHRDLKFWSKCAVLHAKTTGEGWDTETINSGAKVAVFHAQNDIFCLGLLETCYSGPKVSALNPKTTHEGWDP